jgi:tetratricopeptide (TPR) repeat protein
MMVSPRAKAALAVVLLLAAAELRAELYTLSPREIWPQATEAIRTGNMPEANAIVQELLSAGQVLDLERFPIFAKSAASLALEAQERGDGELAEWAIDTARKLDGQSPDVAFATADLARRRGDWKAYATAIAAGVVTTFSNYRSRVLATSDLMLVLCMAAAAAAVLFGLLLLYRYGSVAVHDFREMLSRRFSPPTALVLSWAALVLPLFLWLGPTWLVLYWLVLFFPYSTVRERIVVVLLLLSVAALPVLVAWSAYRISGIDSPVIQAAVAQMEKSFAPEALRRLREMHEVLPNEATIALLMGNLEVQEANERAAAQHYRRAIDMNNKLAGAHLNLGNLYFFENDSKTAKLEYEKAARIDPDMAIAYYNHSVASGESYEFAEQGRQLELAKERDRQFILSLVHRPPRQKVVMYELPLGEAWDLAERIARGGEAREIYGNHAVFDLSTAVKNPLTGGAVLALPAALVFWYLQRKKGTAAACVKCGRTFCYRCKASSESAKYCSQCIHIYLKRDGVSVQTKHDKLQEVQEYQSARMRRARILSTILPGAGQIANERTLAGFAALFLFAFFVFLAIFIGHLAPIAAPAMGMKATVRTTAIVLAIVVWLTSAVSAYRERVVA